MTHDRLKLMLLNRRRRDSLREYRANWASAELVNGHVTQLSPSRYNEDVGAIISACAAPIERMRLSVLDKIDAEIAALEREFEQF